ncbi:hypothetical protein MIR68_001599 [Amoeboaphelidium protococcarum]|nr:hypothetical protein MIR68_001599 [Amoeboaphelidium protococcarum]
MSRTNSPADDGIIRCVCGYTTDDGFTIQCDKCLVWQHAICVNIRKNGVPEVYLCERCDPAVGRGDRIIDYQMARELQRKKRLKLKKKKGGRGGRKSSTASGGGNNNNNNNSNTGRSKRSVSEESLDDDSDDDYFDLAEDYIPVSRNIIPDGDFQFGDLSSLAQLSAEDYSRVLTQIDSVKLSVEKIVDSRSSNRAALVLSGKVDSEQPVAELKASLLKMDEDNQLQLVNERFVFRVSEDLLLDCRRFGNEARFVRYSCRPNCQLKSHIIAATIADMDATDSQHLKSLQQTSGSEQRMEDSVSADKDINEEVDSSGQLMTDGNDEGHADVQQSQNVEPSSADKKREGPHFAFLLIAQRSLENEELTVPYYGTLSGMDVCMDCACADERTCYFNPSLQYDDDQYDDPQYAQESLQNDQDEKPSSQFDDSQMVLDNSQEDGGHGDQQPFPDQVPESGNTLPPHNQEPQQEVKPKKRGRKKTSELKALALEQNKNHVDQGNLNDRSSPQSVTNAATSFNDDLLNKPLKVLSREEKKLREEILRFARMEEEQQKKKQQSQQQQSSHFSQSSSYQNEDPTGRRYESPSPALSSVGLMSPLQSPRSSSPKKDIDGMIEFKPSRKGSYYMKKAWIRNYQLRMSQLSLSSDHDGNSVQTSIMSSGMVISDDGEGLNANKSQAPKMETLRSPTPPSEIVVTQTQVSFASQVDTHKHDKVDRMSAESVMTQGSGGSQSVSSSIPQKRNYSDLTVEVSARSSAADDQLGGDGALTSAEPLTAASTTTTTRISLTEYKKKRKIGQSATSDLKSQESLANNGATLTPTLLTDAPLPSPLAESKQEQVAEVKSLDTTLSNDLIKNPSAISDSASNNIDNINSNSNNDKT